MGTIYTPTNQKRLTNISIVRLKKTGKRFEVACYPNKVIPWRETIETDLDEVLQTPHIYSNVSKGEFAKRQDVERAFGSGVTDRSICELILRTGELQLTERERAQAQNQLMKELATLIAARCLNPSTGKPYPASMVEKAMRDLPRLGLRADKGAKQQMTEVIRRLNATAVEAAAGEQVSRKGGGLLLVRSQMRLCVRLPAGNSGVREQALAVSNVLESETLEHSQVLLTVLCDPGALREIQKLGDVEIVDMRVDVNEEEKQEVAAGGEIVDEIEEIEHGDEHVEQVPPSVSSEPPAAGEDKQQKRRRRKEKKDRMAAAPSTTAESSDKVHGQPAGRRKNKKGQRRNRYESDSDSDK